MTCATVYITFRMPVNVSCLFKEVALFICLVLILNKMGIS